MSVFENMGPATVEQGLRDSLSAALRELDAVRAELAAAREELRSLRFGREWDRRRIEELRRMPEPVEPEELARSGGRWLGAVRNWIQWRCHNGEHVTWGSDVELRPALTVRSVEEIASRAAAAALNERRDSALIALARERRRVRQRQRCILAWAERCHGELATDAARCADECDVRHSDAWRGESKRRAAIAYSFGDRARDRSHDDD